jgi:hypothetical protein
MDAVIGQSLSKPTCRGGVPSVARQHGRCRGCGRLGTAQESTLRGSREPGPIGNP